MKWKGKCEGVRGYKVYKFNTSNSINYSHPTAKYTKEGVFSFIYRRNCPLADRKMLVNGLRQILPFKKNITVIDHKAGATTIEFYCKLETLPSVEIMEKVEKFLQTGKYFIDFNEE